MKQSYTTGKHIYEEIKRLETEARDVEEGMDAVNDEVGTDSIAYRVLKDKYAEIEKQINTLWNTKYEIYNPGENPF